MTPITGRTRLLGVMGWPVEHSRSPVMHAAAIRVTGIAAEGRDVLVIGAGGAARAAACGAAQRHARRVLLLNRTRGKAEALAREFAPAFPQTDFSVLGELNPGALGPGAIILQMTSIGMKGEEQLPADPVGFPDGAVVLEAVYAPPETPFLRACRARGLRTVDGLAMLIAQGAQSFELWTGRPADRAAMRAALRALER